MRVLHVYKTYLPDDFTGVARVIWGIAEALANQGVESHVLCLSEMPAASPITTGHHVTHQVRQDLFIASTSLSLALFGKFHSLLNTVDVVHYHCPWPMADLLHLTNRRIPSVVTYHSDVVKQRFLKRLYAPLQTCFLGTVDRIIATSPHYAASSPILRRHADKTSVISIGIGDEQTPRSQTVAKWRARLGDKFFLFVGALRYYKGLPFLIDAARATGLPVVIAGDGPCKPDDAPDNVTFLGQVSEEDKIALLSLCRGFVFPSHQRSEAFGVALLEAARAGKPMITCEIGTGTSYVNNNGETGLVVPPCDSGALAEAMRILAEDEELAARLGAKARARYERLFQASDMGAAYHRVYRELTAQQKSRVPSRTMIRRAEA
ncbi:glycosyltransferase [Brucella sp. IR073]|uniref:glycosyltransferase n=1 Tax=unclassified Brucella TaxID=2632610 RepID=UPI003B984549